MPAKTDITSEYFKPLVEKYGDFDAPEIKAFAMEAKMLVPEDGVIRRYLTEHYDDPGRNPEARATIRSQIIAVVEAMGPSRMKRYEREQADPGARWKSAHQSLKQNRLVFSALMNAYYGVNVSPQSGQSPYSPEGPIYKTRELIQEKELMQIRLGDIPVFLMMKRAWLPESLVELSALDQKKKILEDYQNEPADLNPQLVENLKTYCKIETTDDPTYHLFGDSVDTGLPAFTFYRSSYHHYQNSCEALSWELACAYSTLPIEVQIKKTETIAEYAARVSGDRIAIQKVLKDVLKQRQQINPFSFERRSVGVGINTITVIAYKDQPPRFFLHKRGSGNAALGEAIGQIHVIPAGTFQPLCHFHDKDKNNFEFSFEHNVMREFGEEMVDKEVLIRSLAYEHSPEDVYLRDDDLKKTKELFDQGYIEQHYLGCGLDLVSLKMEMMTLLIIHGDKYHSSRLPLKGSCIEGELDDVPEFCEESLLATLKVQNLLPAGAGCIARSHVLQDQIHERIAKLLGRQ